MDTKKIIEKAIELGLSENDRDFMFKKVSKIKSSEKQELLYAILDAEKTQEYFKKNHFRDTKSSKALLDVKFTNVCTEILGKIYKPKKFSQYRSNYFEGPEKTQIIHDAVRNLEETGYYIFPIKLQEHVLNNIKKKLQEIPLFIRNKLSTINGYDENNIDQIKGNVAWIKDQQDLNKIVEIQNLIIDPWILEIASNYLNAPPIHVQSNFWVSKRYKESQKTLSQNAQMFHQDREFIKFLKVFVYLDDVDENNGAHVYVKASHKQDSLLNRKDYKVSDRLSDEEIEAVFGSENIITMSGRKGTVIIEDTSGFHKGSPIKRGYRTMLQIEYANSLYFNPVSSFSFDGLDKHFHNLLKDNPRIGLNYDNKRYVEDKRNLQRERNIKNIKGFLKNNLRSIVNK